MILCLFGKKIGFSTENFVRLCYLYELDQTRKKVNWTFLKYFTMLKGLAKMNGKQMLVNRKKNDLI